MFKGLSELFGDASHEKMGSFSDKASYKPVYIFLMCYIQRKNNSFRTLGLKIKVSIRTRGRTYPELMCLSQCTSGKCLNQKGLSVQRNMWKKWSIGVEHAP